MNKKNKLIVAGFLAFLALAVAASLALGQTPTDPISEGLVPEEDVSTDTQVSTEMRSADMLASMNEGILTDPLLDYQMAAPAGWILTEGSPELLRSPDELGLVGYADQSGLALLVTRLPNEAGLALTDWITENELSPYLNLIGKSQGRGGLELLEYQANWGELGVSYGAFLAQPGYVYRIDCFYPAGSRAGLKAARATLRDVLHTFRSKAH